MHYLFGAGKNYPVSRSRSNSENGQSTWSVLC